MKITIVFPGRSLETAKATAAVMPLAPCLLAALTPAEHEIALVDMFFGDRVDYESDADMVASPSALRWRRSPTKLPISSLNAARR